MEKLNEVIEQKVRPVLNAHSGDIELLEVVDGYVKVKLTGACASCPGAQQTLSDVVETAFKEACPEIKGVIPVFQVSDELINMALGILRKDKSQRE
ncbi:MAG: NifU family protein [Negativicutes bacterium]|nr:NifU family protein [Negativicutes bacterium]